MNENGDDEKVRGGGIAVNRPDFLTELLAFSDSPGSSNLRLRGNHRVARRFAGFSRKEKGAYLSRNFYQICRSPAPPAPLTNFEDAHLAGYLVLK